VARRALEKRNGTKLNRAARLKPSADREDRQVTEGANLARYWLGEHRKILHRRREVAFVRGEMNMNLVIASGESFLPYADGDNDTVLVPPFHEQRNKMLEGGHAISRKNGEGIAAARLAAPKMKTIRHFRRGGEGTGIAGQ
jgi:hypothetical protein